MKRAPRNAVLPQAMEVSQNEKAHITNPTSPPSDQRDSSKQKTLSRKQLINKLNHVNFLDRTITVVFKHNKYSRTIAISAQPLPCHDKRLTCNWAERVDIEQIMESYHFQSFYLPKDQQLIEVKPELKSISEKQIVFIFLNHARKSASDASTAINAMAFLSTCSRTALFFMVI